MAREYDQGKLVTDPIDDPDEEIEPILDKPAPDDDGDESANLEVTVGE